MAGKGWKFQHTLGEWRLTGGERTSAAPGPWA